MFDRVGKLMYLVLDSFDFRTEWGRIFREDAHVYIDICTTYIYVCMCMM